VSGIGSVRELRRCIHRVVWGADKMTGGRCARCGGRFVAFVRAGLGFFFGGFDEKAGTYRQQTMTIAYMGEHQGDYGWGMEGYGEGVWSVPATRVHGRGWRVDYRGTNK
jgi:hypothetical protein